MEIIINKIEIGTEIKPTVLGLTVDLYKGLKGDKGEDAVLPDMTKYEDVLKIDHIFLDEMFVAPASFDGETGYVISTKMLLIAIEDDFGINWYATDFHWKLYLDNDSTSATYKKTYVYNGTGLEIQQPATHMHDDRYFTESEINTLLSGKSNNGHGHAISDVSGLQLILNGKSDANHNHTLASLSEKSYNSLTDKPNLDAYIDIIDVQFWQNTENGFPDGMFGDIWYNLENNKLYVFMDGLSWVLLPFDWKFYLNKDENSDFFGKYFVYNGAELSIVPDGLVLGETSQTAFDGLRGKAAYDHANETGNPHGTTAEQVGAAASNHNHALANLTDVQLTTPLTNITTNDSILMWDAETNKAVRILKSDFYAVLDDYFATKSDIGDINTILDDINGEVI